MAGKPRLWTLRDLYRQADYRRFRARRRDRRQAEFVGMNRDGTAMLGWLDGSDDMLEFPPDEAEWTDLTIYV